MTRPPFLMFTSWARAPKLAPRTPLRQRSSPRKFSIAQLAFNVGNCLDDEMRSDSQHPACLFEPESQCSVPANLLDQPRKRGSWDVSACPVPTCPGWNLHSATTTRRCPGCTTDREVARDKNIKGEAEPSSFRVSWPLQVSITNCIINTTPPSLQNVNLRPTPRNSAPHPNGHGSGLHDAGRMVSKPPPPVPSSIPTPKPGPSSTPPPSSPSASPRSTWPRATPRRRSLRAASARRP